MVDEDFDLFEDYLEKIEEGKKEERKRKEKSEKAKKEDKQKKEVHEKITAKEIVKEIIELAKNEKRISIFVGIEIFLTVLLILMLLGVIPFF